MVHATRRAERVELDVARLQRFHAMVYGSG
jgi:hypothetical protein